MAFAILFLASSQIQNLRIVCKPEYDSLVDPSIQTYVDETWTRLKSTQEHLHNALKFKLCAVELDDGRSIHVSGRSQITSNTSPSTLQASGIELYGTTTSAILHLGLTDYRHHLTHDHGSHAFDLIHKARTAGIDPYSYFSNALGVEAIVESVDGHVVFLKRSQNVAEDPGLLGLPGGHAEPEEIMNAKDRIYKDADFSSTLQFSERVAYDVNGKMRNPDAISNEVFDSIKREVVEEVNIPASSIISVGLIGIVTNVNRHGKPDAVFIVRTNLTAKEIVDAYSKGALDAFESTEIETILRENLSTSLHNRRLTTAAAGCLHVYDLFLMNEKEEN